MLNISYIFSILVSSLFICNSILFSQFWIIFTITILDSFSGRLLISCSFVLFGGHYHIPLPSQYFFFFFFILFRLLCLLWPFVGWKFVVFLYCGACSLWVGLCSILCNSMNCSMPGKHSLSFTISLSLCKLMSIESGMPSNHPIFCCPLLLSSVFPTIRVFSNESTFHIRWPKYWSFSFRTSPSNEYSGLISFKSDWFDFLAVQRTLKSLLLHHSSKVSVFGAQPSLWFSSHIHT